MQADYVFVRDLDRHPCATAARDRVLEVFPQVDPARLQIVKTEIESWYCAGIAEDHPWGSLDIARRSDTSTVTKEEFDTAVARKGGLRLPAILALLESFDRDLAARRNESFHRFLRRFVSS